MLRNSQYKTIFETQHHDKYEIKTNGNGTCDSDPSSIASPVPYRYSPSKKSFRRNVARLPSSKDDLLCSSPHNVPSLSETDYTSSDDSMELKLPARKERSSRFTCRGELSFKIQSELSFKYERELSFKSKQQDDGAPPSVEVSPGVYVPLRGAAETMQAIPNDYYAPTSCVSCDSTIFCIEDANYILCPNCRVVSPLEGLYEGLRKGRGGVGLGFTLHELELWQNDLNGCRRSSKR